LEEVPRDTIGSPAADRGRAALDVFVVFLKLGLTSFGGPVAHLGYFRHEFVERRRWLTERAFADLVALCQVLPGPASSQAGFAIGLQRAGPAGGLAAFLGFTAPSALLMFAAATGRFAIPPAMSAPIVHGLVLVAVPVVAHAVVGMARTMCRDWPTALLALAAMAVLLIAQQVWAQPLVIVAGALLGALFLVRGAEARDPEPSRTAIGAGSRSIANMWLAAFLVLLTGLPILAALFPNSIIAVTDAFYRPGALVFGGGHVILPLLEAETVGRGWLDKETFLAGYGAAQAIPGPLTSFAAFLGAASDTGAPAVVNALVALVAIFLPGFLLVGAVLPWWQGLTAHPRAAGFIRGANATVVGVLAAALYDPVAISAIVRPLDAAIAAAGFIALHLFRAPALPAVVLVAIAGAVGAAWS